MFGGPTVYQFPESPSTIRINCFALLFFDVITVSTNRFVSNKNDRNVEKLGNFHPASASSFDDGQDVLLNKSW